MHYHQQIMSKESYGSHMPLQSHGSRTEQALNFTAACLRLPVYVPLEHLEIAEEHFLLDLI